jgi:RNA recognition motif-containing protein
MPANNNNMTNQDQLRTLFLGDLSCFCQETDITNAFQVFGEIKSIRLMRSKQDGKCLGYGFITFETISSAMKALETMTGQVLVGRKLTVNWACKRNNVSNVVSQIPQSLPTAHSSVPVPVSVPKPNNNNYNKHVHTVDTAEIHFSFVSKQSTYLVTEATLRAIFSRFGEIQDISIKKTLFNQKGEQTGYGFIHYPLTETGLSAAINASKVISQLFVDNVLYDCCLTHSLQEFLKSRNIPFPVSHSSSSSSNNSSNAPVKSNPVSPSLPIAAVLKPVLPTVSNSNNNTAYSLFEPMFSSSSSTFFSDLLHSACSTPKGAQSVRSCPSVDLHEFDLLSFEDGRASFDSNPFFDSGSVGITNEKGRCANNNWEFLSSSSSCNPESYHPFTYSSPFASSFYSDNHSH